MAELNVEPKKKTSLFPWLLLALSVIALIVFLSRRHSDTPIASASGDTTTVAATGAASAPVTAATPSGDQGWGDINRNAPGLSYTEIRNKGINVRGTDNYAVYDLGDDVLFDKDKSTIRKDAASTLKEVTASIKQRFDNGKVRLYGFTDSEGSAASNKELAKDRAKAVKQWLISDGQVSADRISMESRG